MSGMVVEKIHEIISFRQSKWLEKYTDVHRKKREERLKMILKRTSLIYFLTLFTEKQSKLRIRIKIEFIKKDDNDKITKQQ